MATFMRDVAAIYTTENYAQLGAGSTPGWKLSLQARRLACPLPGAWDSETRAHGHSFSPSRLFLIRDKCSFEGNIRIKRQKGQISGVWHCLSSSQTARRDVMIEVAVQKLATLRLFWFCTSRHTGKQIFHSLLDNHVQSHDLIVT